MDRTKAEAGNRVARPSAARASSWLMALEPRVMYDGAAAHAALTATAKAVIPAAPAPIEVHAASPAQQRGKREVAFVDTSVSDWQALVAGVEKNNPGLEVDLIDGSQSGLAQIAMWAETHSGYDAIHILSGGSAASATIGSDTINNTTLGNPVVQTELAAIGSALNAGGQLALYGSDIAAGGPGGDGQHLLAALAADTGAVVAASDHAVGTSGQGGDWTLDIATGPTPVAPLAIPGYLGTLTTGAQFADPNPAVVELQAADSSQDSGLREVAFVDTSVAGWETLVTGIEVSRPGMAIELVDGTQSGLAQMATWAATHSGYDAIHVLSHAAEAELYLGSDLLTAADLTTGATKTELTAIGGALKPGGDLLLYGCFAGEGTDGDQFLTNLATDTGATVAGSSHLTGSAFLGGDWVLDRQTGALDVASLDIPGYDNVLGTFSAPTSSFTIQSLGSTYYFRQAVGTINNGVAVLLQATSGSAKYINSYTSTGTLNYSVEVNTLTGVSLPSSNSVQILAASNGDLVVAYNNEDSGDGGSFNAYFVVLGPTGTEVTGRTQINSATGISQTRDLVMAQLTSGDIAFAYQESDDQTLGVRVFHLDGTAVSNEVAIPPGQQDGSTGNLVASSSGGFMVAYNGYVYSGGPTNGFYTDWVGYAIYSNAGTLVLNTQTSTYNHNDHFPLSYAIALSNGDYLFETSFNNSVSAEIYSSAGVAIASANVGGAMGPGYITPVDTASDPGYAIWNYSSALQTAFSTGASGTFAANLYLTRYSNSGAISGAATQVDTDTAKLVYNSASFYYSTDTAPAYDIYSGYSQGLIEIKTSYNQASNGATWTIGANLFEMVSGPGISVVAYDAATGILTLTGSSFTTSTGDYTLADFTLTGANGGTYALGNGDAVTSASATSVAIQIAAANQATVDGLFNAVGTHAANSGTTYNLNAGTGWDTAATAAATNAVTVSDSGTPTLTHANTTAPTLTTLGGTPASIDNGTITATDSPDLAGAGAWAGGSLQVTIGATNHDASHDELVVGTSGGITTSGSGASETISYNGHQIGSVVSGSTGVPGQALRINLSGSFVTDAAVAALVNAMEFTGTAATTAGDRTVSFALTDGYGNATTALSDTVHVVSGPTVSSIDRATGTGMPTNASSEAFTVTFSESVTGVTTSNFTAAVGGSVADTGITLSGSGATYTVTVNGVSGDGTLGVNLSSVSGILDGNDIALLATHTSDQTYIIDNTAPVTANLNGGSNVFVVGGGGVLLNKNSNATVTEANMSSGGVLTVSIANAQATEDLIGLKTAAGHITTSGSGTVTIADNGTSIGSYTSAGNGTGGNNLVVSLATGDTTTQVADLIQALTYNDTSGSPGTTTRTVDVTLTDAAGNVSATNAITVVLDHAPSVAAAHGISLARTATGVALDPAITVADADGNWNGGTLVVQVTANADASHDSLMLPTTSNGGIWLNGTALMYGSTTQIGSANAASVTGGTAWTFTFNANATDASITALADAIELTVTGGGNLASRTVSFTGTDGAGVAGITATDSVTVAAEPTISGGTSHSVNDSGTTSPLSGVSIADGTAEGVTVSLSFADAYGDFTAMSGWSASISAGIRSYARDFASVTAANLALSSLVFAPTAHAGDVGTPQTVTFTVSASGDTTGLATGQDTSASAVITFVNTPPTIIAGGGAVQTYATGGSPVVVDAGVTVTDPDNGGTGNWSGGSLVVHIQSGDDSTHDQLSIASTGTASGIAVASNVVDYHGVEIGTIHTGETGAPGTDLRIDFVAAATDSAVQALAQSIQFGDSDLSSSSVDRTVKFTVTDGATASSNVTDSVHVVLGPVVTTIDRHTGSAAVTNASSVSFDITFSEAVSGVSAVDFGVAATGTATGTVTSVSGSGANWTVTVSGVSGNGTLTLNQTATAGVVDGNSAALIGTHNGDQVFTIDTTPPNAPVIAASISPDTGRSGTDDITSGTTPTLHGTAEANSTVTLYDSDGTTVLATITADASGNWSVATSTLGDGVHSVTAKATDVAGNISVASTVLSVTIETVAEAPVIAATITPDTGRSGTDDITNATAPTLHGTAETNAIVTLYDSNGTTVLATTTADASGNWSVATSALSNGVHSITAKATDVAGNVSVASTALSVTVDTVAPAAPVIAGSITPDTGRSSTDDVTSATTPVLHGTAEANAIVTLYDSNGTTVLATTTSDASGDWSVSTSALSNGVHSITAKATDVAGNVSVASTALSVTVDTVAPAAPVIATSITPDTGRSSTDDITSATAPTLHGIAEANAIVTLYDSDGTTVLATTTADGSGNWSVATSALSNGVHSITAKATDVAGNVSVASTALSVTIDAVAPAAPAIAASITPDTGRSSADDVTSATAPTLHGTAEANAVVTLYDSDGTSVLATTTADGSGNWSVVTSTLSNGVHNITAKATDVAGNVSVASTALSVTIDTVAPAGPVIAASISPDTGRSGTDDITSATAPTLHGTAEANAIVTLYDSNGTTVLATTTADASGNWSLATSALGDGVHSITAKATDVAGNVSVASTALSVTIDTGAPAAPVIAASITPDTGRSSTDDVTGTTTPTLHGTAEASAIVTLYDSNGTTVLATITSDASGDWSVSTSALSNGVHSITAKATDVAGNVSVASTALSVTIDTVAPAAPVIAASITPDTGRSGTDDITNATTPTLHGTAEASAIVTLYDSNGTTVLATTTADVSGNWSVATSPLSNGAHSITAKATDVAGNVSVASIALPVTIDTVAPAAPVIAASVVPDTGRSGTDDITNATTPTLHGTAEAYAIVTLYDSNGTTVLATTIADVSGNWSVATSILAAGTHTITAKAADVAGNVSVASTALSITVETVAQAPVIAASISPDTGRSGTDDITSGTAPVLHGTAEANAIVTLYDSNGTTVLATTAADASGNWSVATSTLGDGVHSITAKATDIAGNVSVASTALSVTIETVAEAPVIAATITPDTGRSGTDDITSAATPTLHGTAEANAIVTLYDSNGTTVLATTTADASGNWSVATNALSNGVHSITAKATDVAGNVSVASTALSVTIDTVAPAAPVIATSITPDTGRSSTDDITSATAPTLHGIAEANAIITLYDSNGTTVLATTTADASGNWSVASTLSNGVHNITAKATDVAGNVSVSSAGLSVTIDTHTPAAPTIAGPTAATNTGLPGITSDTTPVVTGSGEPGSTVTLYDGGNVIGTAAVGPSGTWSLATPPLADGVHSLTATVTDAAGTISPISTPYALTIESHAPPPPAIIGLSGVANTEVSGGAVTSNRLPVLLGTAQPGVTVTIYDGTTRLGAAIPDSSGHWSFAVTTAWADGSHVVTATATDPAANVSAPSGPGTFTIAPTLTNGIPAQSWIGGAQHSLAVPPGTFSVPAGDRATYAAQLVNADGSVAGPLPSWLLIDPATGTVTGAVPIAASGVLHIQLTIGDAHGETAATQFDLAFQGPPTPQAPPAPTPPATTVVAAVPQVTTQVPIVTIVSDNPSVTLPGGTPSSFAAPTPTAAPAVFNPATLNVTSDVPLLTQPASFSLNVTAATDVTVQAGGTISYTIAVDTGHGAADASSIHLSARLADGAPLPSWLKFDPATRTISGEPPPGTRPIAVLVTATDGHGHKAETVVHIGTGPAKDNKGQHTWLAPSPYDRTHAGHANVKLARDSLLEAPHPRVRPGLTAQLRAAHRSGQLAHQAALFRTAAEILRHS